eukprot:1318190-Amorphochlora_amoeboformis.AAC.1
MSTTYQVECRGWDDTKMPVHRLDNIYVRLLIKTASQALVSDFNPTFLPRVAGGEPTMSIAIHAFAATSKLGNVRLMQEFKSKP